MKADPERKRRIRFFLKPIGCKLNTYELEELRVKLERAGLSKADSVEEADVCIVNTCSVTSASDADCRNLIRALARRNPSVRLFVTGCYAHLQPQVISSLPNVEAVVSNADKDRLAQIILSSLGIEGQEPGGEDSARRGDEELREEGVFHLELIDRFTMLTRPVLKIQDGCNSRCSYCTIPFARGPQRSAPPAEIGMQILAFAEAGVKEVVLCGVHLGRYGEELPPSCWTGIVRRREGAPEAEGGDGGHGLAVLLEYLLERLEGTDLRLRLSSMDPNEFGEPLKDLLEAGMKEGRICRHLHIPLQGCNDRILSLMRRPYTVEYYCNLIFELRQRIPGLCIGADVITGFPTESEEEFEEALELIRSLPVNYLHVFPYSEREGTDAAAMEGGLPRAVRKNRARVMRTEARRKRSYFIESFAGATLDCVFVKHSRRGDGTGEFLSDNYIRVLLPPPDMERVRERFELPHLRLRLQALRALPEGEADHLIARPIPADV